MKHYYARTHTSYLSPCVGVRVCDSQTLNTGENQMGQYLTPPNISYPAMVKDKLAGSHWLSGQ